MRRTIPGLIAGVVVIAVGLLVVLRPGSRNGQPQSGDKPANLPDSTEQIAELGAKLYKENCAICHGEQGLGDGPAAQFLDPKPRDFTKGKFKIRSTVSGDLPTEEDLLETLRRGMPGSAMPSFAFLSDKERRALVVHIRKIAVYEVDGKEIRPFELWGQTLVEASAEPPMSEETVARGKEVYEELGCHNCHGEGGLGDGPSAPTLKDDWDRPIRPANLTLGVYKGGEENRDLYLRLMGGMNGTPMPSYAGNFNKEEDAWSLVHYFRSLEGPEAPRRPPVHDTSLVASGWRLFSQMGCATCHGPGGRGGTVNPNYVKDTVPALNTLAERMMLFEKEHAEQVINCLKQGSKLESLAEEPPVPRFNVVLAQYNAIREVIRKGNPAGKKDPQGIDPPLAMPGWAQQLSDKDIDAIVAYLLAIYPWGEEE